MEEKSSFFFVPAVVTYGKSEKTAILTQNYRRKLFKVGAADEVSGVNALNGAHIVTGSAAGALLVINGCKIVFNLDRSLGAGFFTLAASYTAVGANLTHLSTLVMA